MYTYHLVYDIPSTNPEAFRVLVAHKNVYGTRFQNNPTPPVVLNGAGQLVIPGGSAAAGDVITGGRTEFFEETGIDLRQTDVRKRMGCVGDAWYQILDHFHSAYCVYQKVQDAELVENACNTNIGNGIPQDDELYSTRVYDGSAVRELFGPISLTELTSGWRGAQYGKLDPEKKKRARDKSQDPGDWYVKAVRLLRTVL